MNHRDSERDASWVGSFLAIWTGQAFSLLGSQLVQFALIWWLTEQTNSATMLAMATLAGMLPGIVIGPIAGVLVDRWDRRLTMICADGLIALATLLLAILHRFGVMQTWHILLLMFVRATAGGFQWPAMQASTSLMVPESQLGRVAGMSQALGGAIRIIAPPLGALLLGLVPLSSILAIDVGTAALAIGPLLFIAIPQPARDQRHEAQDADAPLTSRLWRDFVEGIRYLGAWPAMMAFLSMAVLANLILNPAFALMPILVTRHFGQGVQELAWIDSAMGIGVVVGGLILGAWGGFGRRVMTILLGITGTGIGLLLVGLAPAQRFWQAIVGILLAGGMIALIDGPFIAILQSRVDPTMQGRILGLVGSIVSAAAPLSMMIAGPVADALGVSIWYTAGGITCLALATAPLAIPALMRLEDETHSAPRTRVRATEPPSIETIAP